VVRTHDVRETVDAATIGAAFTDRRAVVRDGVTATELDVRRSREVTRHLERIGATDRDGDPFVGPVFEVRGLGSEATDALVQAASETGAVVRTGDGSLLVGGRRDTLSALADRLPEGTGCDALVDALRT
jgi:dihydropteroate synthase